MVKDKITIRPTSVADIPDLVRLRRMMFEAMGYDDPVQLADSDVASETYFGQAIPAGEFYGWLALTPAGVTVSSGGVVIDRHPPGPSNLTGRIGYIMNVVTDPAYRRRGIARRMMKIMVDWLTKRDIQCLSLHATEIGRPLYEELGFTDSNEMRLSLRR